jgi:hypothetical protein
MRQLDLLDWKPPCQVIAFPLAKRIGKVRRVADILAEKHGAAAKSYWKQTILTMAGQMQRAGVDQDAIGRELRSFHDAVQQELCRRGGHRQRPGGNAA